MASTYEDNLALQNSGNMLTDHTCHWLPSRYNGSGKISSLSQLCEEGPDIAIIVVQRPQQLGKQAADCSRF